MPQTTQPDQGTKRKFMGTIATMLAVPLIDKAIQSLGATQPNSLAIAAFATGMSTRAVDYYLNADKAGETALAVANTAEMIALSSLQVAVAERLGVPGKIASIAALCFMSVASNEKNPSLDSSKAGWLYGAAIQNFGPLGGVAAAFVEPDTALLETASDWVSAIGTNDKDEKKPQR